MWSPLTASFPILQFASVVRSRAAVSSQHGVIKGKEASFHKDSLLAGMEGLWRCREARQAKNPISPCPGGA